MNWTDPYGAPEFFVNEMRLETMSPSIVWARMIYRRDAESILRVTLIMPATLVPTNIAVAEQWLGGRRAVAH